MKISNCYILGATLLGALLYMMWRIWVRKATFASIGRVQCYGAVEMDKHVGMTLERSWQSYTPMF